MKRWILALASALSCMGCTTLSLERQTLAQTRSVSDLRYREVLDNLALIADNPAALPSYSSIFAGTSQVTDTWQFGSSTAWGPRGWTGTGISPQLSRNITDNWSLDPILHPEKLEAMRCASRCVLYGPEKACGNCLGLLVSPEQDHSPGRHFGVADRLERLPAGWLHVGKLRDIPAGACYKAHHGSTWVWVMPEGMQGFSDFTLVLQDIARVSINSPSLFYWPPPPSTYTRVSGPQTDDKDKAKAGNEGKKAVPPQDPRTLVVSVFVDQSNRIVPYVPYRQYRLDTVVSDPTLRSQVSAAGSR